MAKVTSAKSKAIDAANWKPLTPETWVDFEVLFGERGACGGCWCMTWRQSRAEFNENKGAGNKAAFRSLVESGREPGILLYDGSEAVGWCSIAPRQEFVALERSRVWAPVDQQPVWSVTCFFVRKDHRKQGLSVALLNAAVEFAKRKGARIIEGYPQQLKNGPLPAAFVWTGLYETFKRCGFKVAARRSDAKPIMRLKIE